MKRLTILLPVLLLAACASPSEPGMTTAEAESAVSDVLDALHEAAAQSEFDRYFGLYTEDAIFMGTDATERWTVDEFKEYARVPFQEGRGWTYTMTERNVFIGPGGRTAWFDERLENANLGDTRGTGALVLRDGSWKIAQYNLTIPVPNSLARAFVAEIRALESGE